MQKRNVLSWTRKNFVRYQPCFDSVVHFCKRPRLFGVKKDTFLQNLTPDSHNFRVSLWVCSLQPYFLHCALKSKEPQSDTLYFIFHLPANYIAIRSHSASSDM